MNKRLKTLSIIETSSLVGATNSLSDAVSRILIGCCWSIVKFLFSEYLDESEFVTERKEFNSIYLTDHSSLLTINVDE